MRIVIDTNVLISGIIFGGKPSKIIELLFGKKYLSLLLPKWSTNTKEFMGNLGNDKQKGPTTN